MMRTTTAQAQSGAFAKAGESKSKGGFNSDLAQLWIGGVLVALTGFGPLIVGNSYWIHTFQLVNIYISAAIFQNFLFVDAGQKSFGQGAILGIAAYGAAILFGLHGWSFGLAALGGIVAAVAGGLLFALPALRVQGFHLGFVTMSAAIVFPQLLVTLDKWTNGINGISISVPWLTDTLAFGLSPLAFVIAVFPMLALAVHYKLRRSRLGRSMFVAALSPEAARSLGIKPGLMRFTAFVIASIGTGICGVLYLPAVAFVSPQGFNIELSFVFFFAVIVGGRGQMLGPIIGIWIVFILPNIMLAQFVEYRLLMYGCLTLAAVLIFPDGVVGSVERLRARRQQTGGGENAFRIDGFLALLRSGKDTSEPAADVAVEVRGGTKTFGAVVAVDAVDLKVRKGEVHGLIGANGSGKTSLLNVLTGLSKLDAGSVMIHGTDVTRRTADGIANMGMGRTFQAPRIFAQLSLWDNLRIGIDARVGPGSPDIEALAHAMEMEFGQDSASLLSHGQRRLVEVMRTVLKEATIVLFDEPAAGLSQTERQNFATLVRFLSRQMGKTIILVEHDLDLVWGIADTITVLEQGRVVSSGKPTMVARDPAVQHMFVGARHA
ncbi:MULTISPECIES: ATP-binding cassette domain-containing protein [unclassified Bradyrhizobium]|uniref:branched-chain amino acid ABC transporter ATP-binding protein/permease n=1 Tax=unclassified Bradyrhizobium TaxID=2631580 RepID=UPI002012D852|nr:MULTISPECIES: ATP-binding cassette domain-containing protein [unclassified Bradyrhizobium]